jgi:hypothetical protein
LRPNLRLLRFRQESLRRIRTCTCEALEARIALSGNSTQSALLSSPQLAPSTTESYSGGVLVTSTQIYTPYETIPRFVASPTISALRSGDWSDPSIWSQLRVPTTGDRIAIGKNITVNYAITSDARLDCMEISGSLIFSTSADTRMLVGTVTVMPPGTLQIGTQAAPVQQGVEAELVFADKAINTTTDPREYGTGLIALGTVTIHGEDVNKTWVRLGGEPKKGDTQLIVTGDISGWGPGDELLLPDSRQVRTSAGDAFNDGQSSYWEEEAVIKSIAGNRITLEAPLQFSHPGARNTSGVLELLPHVALLQRNVELSSENPEGTRGHTLFTARANVNIQFAKFEDLGRTDNDREIDDTVVNGGGQVSHRGTNQSGRYNVYFDHLFGPENPSNTGYQFQFVGNAIEYTKKWGVAVNDSSFGLISGNVIYDADGAGFVTCAGSEIGNMFSNNITIGVSGTYEAGEGPFINVGSGDYARGGSGFWFRRGGNSVVGNVATASSYAGFTIDGYYDPGTVRLPKYRGAMTTQSDQTTPAQLNPSASFIGNEAYGMSTYGVWLAFISGNNLLPNQPRTTIANMSIWSVLTAGVRAYHTSDVTFDNTLILGDRAAQDRNDTGTRGFDLRYYENRNLIISNSRVEGVRYGIIAPNNDASEPGIRRPTIVNNTILKNYINVLVMPGLDDRPSDGASLVLRDVKFTMVTTLPC